MFSVLIPTFNYNCFPFVRELHIQLLKEKINFEIICFDDGSNSELNLENEKINSLSNSKFEALKINLGRSSIRNSLVREAKHDWILFLDADGFPVENNFIKTYLNNINNFGQNFSGFVGGRVHERKKKKNLRVNFGIKREELPVDIRNKNPYRFFFTSNIALKKVIFESINFNEKLIGYGYEDLLFGNEMREKKYKISHINNPVYHLNIEDNVVFINKTKQGLNNLFFLKQQKLIHEKDIKILIYFNKIKRLGLKSIMKNKLNFFINKAINTSSLFYYDLFKLSYLLSLNDEEIDETK